MRSIKTTQNADAYADMTLMEKNRRACHGKGGTDWRNLMHFVLWSMESALFFYFFYFRYLYSNSRLIDVFWNSYCYYFNIAFFSTLLVWV